MSNFFGQLLNEWRMKRRDAIDQSQRDLLKTYGLNPQDYDQRLWALRQSTERKPDGTETTEIRLYKLFGAVVVDASLKRESVEIIVKKGISALRDFPEDPTHPLAYKEGDEP